MKNLMSFISKNMRDAGLHPLQKTSLFGLLVLVGISISVGGVSQTLQNYADYLASAILPGVIVELTNIERKEDGVPALSRSSVLDEAARLKAEHMRDKEYFAHFSPEENISPWHWFRVAGYDYIHAGENLAIYFNDSADVVKAWMESPLHRENIMEKNYTEIGVAAVEGVYKGYKTFYVVQLFGTPMSQNHRISGINENDLEGSLEKDTEPEILENETPEEIFEEEPESTPEEEELQVEEELTTEITPTTAGDGSVVLLSEHITTVNPFPVAGFRITDIELPQREPVGNLIVFQILYAILAFLISILLSLSILLSTKRKEYARVIYGSALLLLLMLAVYTHTHFISI